jgi:hypothetical protein
MVYVLPSWVQAPVRMASDQKSTQPGLLARCASSAFRGTPAHSLQCLLLSRQPPLVPRPCRGPTRRGSEGKVLLLRRPLFVALLLAATAYCWWRSRAWLGLFGGLLLGEARACGAVSDRAQAASQSARGCVTAGSPRYYAVSAPWPNLAPAARRPRFAPGVGLPLVHATFRSPNLKARLASAREEFRAVW